MSDNIKQDRFRSRTFCMVLYPEDPTHVEAMDRLHKNGYQYAACQHDRDTYEDGPNAGEVKKAHWHVVLRCKNAIWNTALAKDLGITPNYVEHCRNLDGSLLYLVHAADDDQKKAQYDVEEVFGPLKLKLVSLLADTDEGTRVANLVEIIENSPGPISYTELVKKAVAAGIYSDLRRMGHLAVCIVREHNDQVWRELSQQESYDNNRTGFDDFLHRSPNVNWVTRIDICEKNKLPPKPLEP